MRDPISSVSSRTDVRAAPRPSTGTRRWRRIDECDERDACAAERCAGPRWRAGRGRRRHRVVAARRRRRAGRDAPGGTTYPLPVAAAECPGAARPPRCGRGRRQRQGIPFCLPRGALGRPRAGEREPSADYPRCNPRHEPADRSRRLRPDFARAGPRDGQHRAGRCAGRLAAGGRRAARCRRE